MAERAPNPTDETENPELKVTRVKLSDEAATLLLITADDPNGGQVLVVNTFGGTHVQANQTRVNKPNDRRSEAKWVKAIEDLVGYGLLKDVGYKGEVFEITYDGYKAADELTGNGFKRIALDSDELPTES